MTSTLGGLAITLSSFVFLYLLLLALIKIFYKQWWIPTRIKKRMNLQGVKGPPYRLIHGNTKEISNMIKEAMSRPKSLSHDILTQIYPHIQSWSKKYGILLQACNLIINYLYVHAWLLNMYSSNVNIFGNRSFICRREDLSSMVWYSSSVDSYGYRVVQRDTE